MLLQVLCKSDMESSFAVGVITVVVDVESEFSTYLMLCLNYRILRKGPIW